MLRRTGELVARVKHNGRFVAFASAATNLVPGDTNGKSDVFVRDLEENTIQRMSISHSGSRQTATVNFPALSGDGRFVAFMSDATNLVPGDTTGKKDVFVYDRQAGTTERVSVASGGSPANQGSFNPAMSGDGRYVAFSSSATNLAPGDANGQFQIFLHDRQADITERVSVTSDRFSGYPSIARTDATWPSRRSPPTWCRGTRITAGTSLSLIAKRTPLKG